jgi:hypothetical protein
MALILEVLDGRGGGVRTRLRLEALPVRIGRALDNDLILEDAYVDARHAHITRAATGEIIVEDLGSLNGMTLAGAGERVASAAVAAGTELRLGRTVLRFRDSTEPVAAALPDEERESRLVPHWAGTRRGHVIFSLVALAAIGLSGWIDSYERSAAEDAFALALGIAMMATLWAGIWAVAGRMLVQRFRFFAHFALVLLMLLVVFVLATVNEWIVFLYPDSPAPAIVGGVAGLFLVAALVAGHLGLATALSARRRWQAGAATVMVILALASAGAIIADDAFSDVPEFAGTVKAVRGSWVPTHTVAAFGDVTLKLQQEVDALLEQ